MQESAIFGQIVATKNDHILVAKTPYKQKKIINPWTKNKFACTNGLVLEYKITLLKLICN